ncbi:MAG: CBS domain-containing protein [archaeon]
MENILVADVMTRDTITAKPDTNLLECAKKMVRKRVGSLPLVTKNKLVGFISEKDILWAMIKKPKKEELSKIKAINISTKKIATIKPHNTIEEAIAKMKKLKFEKLPVINKGQFVGILTFKDILNFNPEFYPELEEFAQIREESKKLERVNKAKHRNFIHQGMCEECGNQDVLEKIDGRLLCEGCKNLT